MNINDIAEEIYPGIILVDDLALERMSGHSCIRGTLVPDYSDAMKQAQDSSSVWEKLIKGCPDVTLLTSEEVQEIRRRLFSNHHILIARSETSNPWKFRYFLEHEYFEKLCESEAEVNEMLKNAYGVLLSDSDASFLIMALFRDTVYRRFPPAIEFWAQWFRPGFVDNYQDWQMLSSMKATGKSLDNASVQAAIEWVENDAPFKVTKDVSKILQRIKINGQNPDILQTTMTKTILIIDNEPHLCDMLKEIIEDEGGGKFQVDYATNLSDAMRLAREKIYDLMLVDIRLNASESGVDIIKRCRDLEVKSKMVIYSAISRESLYPALVKEGIAHVVSDFLDKNNDLSIKELMHYIEWSLEK